MFLAWKEKRQKYNQTWQQNYWLQQVQSFSKEKSQHRTKELVLINCIQNAFFVSMKSVVVKHAHKSTCNAIKTIAMFVADFFKRFNVDSQNVIMGEGCGSQTFGYYYATISTWCEKIETQPSIDWKLHI